MSNCFLIKIDKERMSIWSLYYFNSNFSLKKIRPFLFFHHKDGRWVFFFFNFTKMCHREQPNITTPFHNHVEATCFLPFLSLVIFRSENEIQILSNCGYDRWKKKILLFYWSAFVFLLYSTGSITNPQSPWEMDFTGRQNANFAQRCVNATCPDGPFAYS